MTCIVAITDRKKVWIGADSLATDGGLNKYKMSMPKVWEKGDFVMGGAGAAVMLQELTANFNPINVEYSDAWVYGPFIEQLKAFMTNSGLGNNTMLPGNILMGFNGSIFSISEDYFTCRPQNDYDSIGSGSGFALGSLAKSKGSPQKRITAALEAAVEHNAGCEGPFTIISGARRHSK